MSVVRIGIVGSRRRDTNEDLQLLLDRLIPILEMYDREGKDITIVSGGCPFGGDRFAEIIIDQFGLKPLIHRPDKSQLPRNPERRDFARINFARNTLIARDSDVLIAILAETKGGTDDTVRKFKKFHPKGVVILIGERNGNI